MNSDAPSRAEIGELPIKLTARQVALAAKAAYDEGRLSAQGPTPACQYRDPSGRPCAIGAALPEAAAYEFDRRTCSGVSDLAGDALLVVDDLPAIGRLQRLHDIWTDPRGYAAACEAAFLAHLNSMLSGADQ